MEGYLVLKQIQPFLLTKNLATFRTRYFVDISDLEWPCRCARYRCLREVEHFSTYEKKLLSFCVAVQ